jgi:very-short-patch-repair endonuclease
MPSKRKDSARDEVLVAILNSKADLAILQEQLWYPIPVVSAPKRWPPKWLAFYRTKVFGPEAYAVNYCGRVSEIRVVRRAELFPNEIDSARSERPYYQLRLESVEPLPRSIISRKFRRVVFIPTTRRKLDKAEESNDLFDDSPLEDQLWHELKRLNIPAERQWPAPVGENFYQLDFAIFCADGNIDVEADGDTWHAKPDLIPRDNDRNNALTESGWRVLRFNGKQSRDASAEYCTTRIANTINRLGSLDEGLVPRKFHTDGGQTN